MTSVLSLTVTASAGFTNAQSFLLLVDQAGTSKKMDVRALGNYGLSYIGAMRRVGSNYTDSNINADFTFDTVVYDTGSFTTSSGNILSIVNDTIKYVQLGVYVQVADGEFINIYFRKNGSALPGGPLQSCEYLRTADTAALTGWLNMVSPPVPVSSGDYFTVQHYQPPSTVYANSYSSAFWIRKVA